ncbi:MAG: hypothetical protein CL676_12230 [Bdellovibrionaceae bacterium]|nr:hypothetical protein [Pseudobdellovibrionaceae bacterium]
MNFVRLFVLSAVVFFSGASFAESVIELKPGNSAVIDTLNGQVRVTCEGSTGRNRCTLKNSREGYYYVANEDGTRASGFYTTRKYALDAYQELREAGLCD